MATTFRPFDPAAYLDNDEIVTEYLTACLEDENPEVFLCALNDAARARGIAGIAERAGLGRESLYKALAPGAHPRHETIARVIRAMGLRMTITPA